MKIIDISKDVMTSDVYPGDPIPELKKIKTSSLTIGDIVILEAGDIVPCDCRIIESNNLNYPNIVNIMRNLKDKLHIDLDIYKYNIKDAVICSDVLLRQGLYNHSYYPPKSYL